MRMLSVWPSAECGSATTASGRDEVALADADEIIPGGMSSALPLDTPPATEHGGSCLASMPP
jgi:hypothetical protein